MDGFWNVVESWTPMGQGVFLLLIVWASLSTVRALAYYATILVQGWPPEHVRFPDEIDPSEM